MFRCNRTHPKNANGKDAMAELPSVKTLRRAAAMALPDAPRPPDFC